MSTKPTLWIDFETGGTDPYVHSPLSFAMIATRGTEIFGEWYVEIRQEPLVVLQQSMAINKLDLLAPGLDFKTFRAEYWKRMNEWFYGGSKPDGRSVDKIGKANMPFLGGQNVGFDRAFLHRTLDSSFDGIYYHSKDLMVLANAFRDAGALELENVSLTSIAGALDLRPEGELHNALVDIKLTFACWNKLVDQMKKP